MTSGFLPAEATEKVQQDNMTLEKDAGLKILETTMWLNY
jgi:hypothetical protein